MYRIVILTGLIFLAVPLARAQDAMDFKLLNQESYRLYLEQKWDSVIVVGKTALKQDVDFYYLRMRMGIARYSQKKYRQAQIHFRKALEFNQADPPAMEYLYYALLFSGQSERANLVRESFRGELALKLPPLKGKAVNRLGAEFLYYKGLNEDLLSDPESLFSGLPPGVQYVTRSFYNASLNMQNSLAPGISLNHLFTYLSKNSYAYYNDGLLEMHLDPQHVKQYQYYISPSFTTLSGFTFLPMFHVLSIHYQTPIYYSNGYQGGNPTVAWGYADRTNLISGLNMVKNAGVLDFQLGAWWANLNDRQQIQNRLGLTYYPLGNLNFYLGAYLNTQYEMTDTTGILRIIPEFQAGFSIAEKLWVDLNAAFGDMSNYLEQNGSVVFNSFSDIIQKKVTLNLSLPITEKGSLLYLGGRWTAHESTFYPFDPANSDITNAIFYNAISIYGGILWKF